MHIKRVLNFNFEEASRKPKYSGAGQSEYRFGRFWRAISIDQHDDDLLCTGDTSHPSWTEEMLVEEIRHMRCLWDTSCRAYKDGLKKQQAWKDICSKFGVQGQGM